MRLPVQEQTAKINHIPLVLRTLIVLRIASNLCFHPGNQLQWIERLWNIIISTKCQTRDLIHILRLRCQHDHRKCIFLTNLLQNLESVHIRKHDIQNRKINLRTGNTIKRFLTRIKFQHIILIILQV